MLLFCLFFGISIESMMQSTIARCNWENKTQHSFLSLFVISKEIFIQLFNILLIRNYKYNGRSSHFGKKKTKNDLYSLFIYKICKVEKTPDQLRKYTCRLRWLFCIIHTLSHRWQSKQQRFNDYYNYYCLLKYRDSTQYWNIENYFVTWHLIDARLFWLLLWQQLTLILIHNYLIFLFALSFSVLKTHSLSLSLWIIVRFYWTIIV